MRLLTTTGSVIGLALAVGACSLSGLIGGGAKPPLSLVTLTPEVASPGDMVRSAAGAQPVTVETPIVAKELEFPRVPVQLTPTTVQYVANLQLVDTPDRLFRGLLEETLRRTTSRVVLDPAQSALAPGITVSGQLQRFGFDAPSGKVVVTFDAALTTHGGLETRRFTASAPSDGTAASVGPALNQAANEVAIGVAHWIGG